MKPSAATFTPVNITLAAGLAPEMSGPRPPVSDPALPTEARVSIPSANNQPSAPALRIVADSDEGEPISPNSNKEPIMKTLPRLIWAKLCQLAAAVNPFASNPMPAPVLAGGPGPTPRPQPGVPGKPQNPARPARPGVQSPAGSPRTAQPAPSVAPQLSTQAPSARTGARPAQPPQPDQPSQPGQPVGPGPLGQPARPGEPAQPGRPVPPVQSAPGRFGGETPALEARPTSDRPAPSPKPQPSPEGSPTVEEAVTALSPALPGSGASAATSGAVGRAGADRAQDAAGVVPVSAGAPMHVAPGRQAEGAPSIPQGQGPGGVSRGVLPAGRVNPPQPAKPEPRPDAPAPSEPPAPSPAGELQPDPVREPAEEPPIPAIAQS